MFGIEYELSAAMERSFGEVGGQAGRPRRGFWVRVFTERCVEGTALGAQGISLGYGVDARGSPDV